MTTCPPYERIRAFVERLLTADELGDVARHVDVCPRCQRYLADPTASPNLNHTPASPSEAPTQWPPPQIDEDAPAGLSGYHLTGDCRKGGMGAVYFGRDVALSRAVAVKVLRRRLALNAESVNRFEYEARVTSQLQHPGIVPVHAVGQLDDHRPYFVMAHVKGKTLYELLKARQTPAAELLLFLGHFQKICGAMEYAHDRNVIHRDLKPDNVMVGRFGEVLVMDWGLAKYLSDPDLPAASGAFLGTEGDTREGAALGTLPYMPPEQATGDTERVDKRSDVFSLGGILCVILTGKPPYRAPSPDLTLAKATRADLADAHERLAACAADAELVDLVRRCLDPDREKRPADAGAVSRAVEAYLAGVESRRQQARVEQRAAEVKLAEGRKRRRVLAILWAVSLLTALFAVALLALTASRAEDRRRIAEEKSRGQEIGRRHDHEKALRLTIQRKIEDDERRQKEDDLQRKLDARQEELRKQKLRANEWQTWAGVIGRSRALNAPFAQARAALLTDYLNSPDVRVSDEQLPVVRAELTYLTHDAWGPLTDGHPEPNRLPAFAAVAYLPQQHLLLALSRQRRGNNEPALFAWHTQKGSLTDYSPLLGNDVGDLSDYRVAVTPDGDRFVLLTPAGDLIFCSTKPRRDMTQLIPHGTRTEGLRLAWEHQGGWLASVGKNGKVHFWKPEGDAREWKPKDHKDGKKFLDAGVELLRKVNDDPIAFEEVGLCVLSDGELVLLGNEKLPKEATEWTHLLRFDVERGIVKTTKEFAKLTRHELESMTASPSSRRIAWADAAGSVTIWQVDDKLPSAAEPLPAVPSLNPERRSASRDGDGPFVSLTFSPDGERLAVARPDGDVHLLDVATGKRIASFLSQTTGKGDLPKVFFDRDGNVLVVGPASGSVRRWGPRSLLRPVLGWPKTPIHLLPLVRRVAASPEGEWAVLGTDGFITHLDRDGGRLPGEWKPTPGKPTSLACLSQKRLLVQMEDGSVYQFDAAGEYVSVFVPRLRPGALWSGHDWPLATSPKGDLAAFCDPAGRVALYRPAESDSVRRLPRLVAADESEPIVRMDATDDPTPLHTPMKARPGAMAFDRAGKRLAVVTQDGVVWVFDVAAPDTQPRPFPTGVKWASSICWSPDEKELIVGDRRDHVSVWRVDGGGRVARCSAVVGPSLAFPPGCPYHLTFDGDRVHILETGREIPVASFTPLPPRRKALHDVFGLAFAMAASADGERLLVARVGEPPVILDWKGTLGLLRDPLERLRRETDGLIRIRLANNEFVAAE